MQGIFSLNPSYRNIETCNLLDIWSDWWGNMTWPKKDNDKDKYKDKYNDKYNDKYKYI